MRFVQTLTGLALVACIPASSLAADPSGDYSSLRPGTETKIEAAPTDLDQSMLVQMAAEVVETSLPSRTVTLKIPDGRLATLRVGKDVTNLGEIKPGDLLEVTYYVGKQVILMPPGSEAPGTTKEVMEGKNAPIDGVVGQQILRTVTILDVDRFKKTVTFRDANDQVREMALGGTNLEDYLDQVKKGDTVQVSFVEALALALKPVDK
jgi:hypothetical protein